MKKIIHPGTMTLKSPERFRIDVDYKPDGTRATKKTLVDPATTSEVKLPPETRFGKYKIGVEYEVDDATAAALMRRGFVEVEKPPKAPKEGGK